MHQTSSPPALGQVLIGPPFSSSCRQRASPYFIGHAASSSSSGGLSLYVLSLVPKLKFFSPPQRLGPFAPTRVRPHYRLGTLRILWDRKFRRADNFGVITRTPCPSGRLVEHWNNVVEHPFVPERFLERGSEVYSILRYFMNS